MYTVLLTAHSWLRWGVVLAGLMSVVGNVGARPVWTPADTRAARVFVGMIDLQMTLGLILYLAVSPFTQAAFGNFSLAMHDTVLRFWAVEHITGMLLAVTLAHLGQVRSRRQVPAQTRHRAALIWFGASLVAILVTMPWPFLHYGRPLLRW